MLTPRLEHQNQCNYYSLGLSFKYSNWLNKNTLILFHGKAELTNILLAPLRCHGAQSQFLWEPCPLPPCSLFSGWTPKRKGQGEDRVDAGKPGDRNYGETMKWSLPKVAFASPVGLSIVAAAEEKKGLSFESCLYILDPSPVSDTWYANISSQSVACPSVEQKFYILYLIHGFPFHGWCCRPFHIFCPWLSFHLFTVIVPFSLRMWPTKGETRDPTCIFYSGCAVNPCCCGFYVPGEKKGMGLQACWSALWGGGWITSQPLGALSIIWVHKLPASHSGK